MKWFQFTYEAEALDMADAEALERMAAEPPQRFISLLDITPLSNDRAAMAIDPEPPGVTLRKMTPEEQAALDLAPVNYGIPVTKDEAKWIALALKSHIRYLRSHTEETLDNLVSMERLRERFAQLSD